MIMSNMNNVDKVYLALELTKLKYYPLTDNARCYGYGEIYSCFEYFLQKLTNTEDLSVIEEYKTKVEQLTTKCSQLAADNEQLKLTKAGFFKNRIDDIKKYVNDNGGNMEPDVKKQLLTLLDNIFNY